ncbi:MULTISPECIES: oxepin-CoA hydrolase, alternative type [Ralstonia]|jgi:enoyl-CoA hydratase/carnithine racemase|uniref:2,3-dehydroadipyl-CoA hydratase n=5 Tax=Pseudomonadota TaxID=1224 RepID=A0ABN9I8A5_RALPI|nr:MULTISPECIES: enoyl-CoA hydratase [Ralstonia]MBA4201944.1 enoyl-CoA hydratase [Ralstonia sp.]MBA4232673.1 enoyl-CoA hydratase [Ralstonia sp.]MBA4238130.1 enoyl-CoA hydratase [Ralstonia sp.]MBA4279106.1 enoyl-CoA hydratase [Ralstonia sp.]MBA4295452.1 enoyl-CoA hydratase [Ralstonia sp.]
MTAQLLSKRIGSTLVLTLSNPDARNALDPVMYTASMEALDRAANDNEIRAVIFTGDGNAFCAGGNLNRLLENRSKPRSVQEEGIDALNQWIETIRTFPKPVIAAVEGPAAGAGFSLVLACDFAIAASDANFVMAYVNVALTPDGGGSWHIARFLPRPLASEIIMLGKPVSAERLAHFGLINEVVKPGEALDQAVALAEKLAAQSPHAVGRIKGLIAHAEDASLHDHLKAEQHSFVEALHHADGNEGISAFLQKRKPQYR